MSMATRKIEPLIHNYAPAPFTHERPLTNKERRERWNEKVKQYMILLVDNNRRKHERST